MGLKSIYLGIDLGTTTVKGLAMNDDGQVLANFLKETPLVSRQSDWAEQSPEFWWSSLLEIVNLIKTKVDLKQVQGIGLSGQMHGLVTYDSHFRALRRAIIWMDKRSSAEVEMILKNFGPKLYQITGNPIFTGFLLPSLIWIKKHEPHIYQKIHKISSPKDYLAYRLTGALRSEPTDALATAAFDYHKNTWSDKIISAGKLKRSLFPEIRSTLEPYGGVSEKIARITGIPAGTLVFGASDQAMSAMGTGLIKPGQTSIAISTGGQFLVTAPKGLIDPKRRLHTLNHAFPDIGLYMAATLSAGFSLRWFKDFICEQKEIGFPEFTASLAKINPGANGLFFLPFLSGERTPYFNPNLRAAFIGLSSAHKRLHLARAIIEGVSFSMHECLKVFQELHLPVNKVILSGGGAQNPVWRQILADVLNLPMKTINIQDHSPFGAAVLAKFAREGLEKLPDFYKKVIIPIDYLYPQF
ncbi:MAG: Xylulose kinase [Candidatus Beckwithbacteria bacterium GW2011_GWA2_43_10]|uniref:Xylulose kinase n=1 Tax=Candidatus Beckwithbacteria bacterium GW2011_GWA2_43_10 TaxID=1618369 RepID=A0A0G1C0A0_9BACT|nr:MAG: Xylulose kinase [Candidatus Beckwithbacteria bacterium GW2011_GWA2_43_10]